MKWKPVFVVLVAALLAGCGLGSSSESQGYSQRIGDTGCTFTKASMRGDGDLKVAISGPRYNSATVDVTLPGESEPLPVSWQMPKKFIDTEQLYIHQAFKTDWDFEWPTGTYTVSVVNQGKRGQATFWIGQEADWILYVHCK